MALERLDRLLVDLAAVSRKEARELIRSGRVSVDGTACLRPEQKTDPEKQKLSLDGKDLVYRRFHYLMMNKPAGVVTATEDRTQKTVLDLLPEQLRYRDLFPVGRLDKDTEGLLLLTDDGDFAHRVISPRSAVEKRYLAEIEGETDEKDVEAFRDGLTLRDGTLCLPAGLESLGPGKCVVTVTEGKYHQVRRMLASRGKHVIGLKRLSIGALELGETLKPGEVRELSDDDLCNLFIASFREK